MKTSLLTTQIFATFNVFDVFAKCGVENGVAMKPEPGIVPAARSRGDADSPFQATRENRCHLYGLKWKTTQVRPASRDAFSLAPGAGSGDSFRVKRTDFRSIRHEFADA